MKIAIVEDELNDVERLRSCLEKYAADNKLSFDIKAFNDGLTFLTEYKNDYDLVFLDMIMPRMDGLSCAEKLRAKDKNVSLVFVTNMKQYAIKGYEVEACDFIVKPLVYNKFAVKMNRILRIARNNHSYDVMIVTQSDRYRVDARDILYVEVLKHKLCYHLEKGEIEAWGTLKNVAEVLKDYGFAFCNSGYLVNLNCVTAVEGNEAVMVNGDRLAISRPKKKEFLEALAFSLNGML